MIALDPAPLPLAHVVLGNRAIVNSGGKQIFLKKMPSSEAANVRLEDIRILPVMFDAQGTRRREFNSSVSSFADSVPQGGGLQLQGPTSILNLVKMMRDQNLGSHSRSCTR